MRRDNHLDLLRLIAASLVFYSHSFALLGRPSPQFLSWIDLGTLGVYIFFIVSGYLISASWEQDPSLPRFFARRALRIFPGLWVCVLLTLFLLGPLLTTRGLPAYFTDWRTWRYLGNLGLYTSYYLPGVFETVRYPNAVNGSIWTLPIEFLMYLVVAGAGVLRGNRWFFVGLFATSAALAFFWASRAPSPLVVFAMDAREIFICGTYFWAGAVFRKFNLDRHCSLTWALLAGAGMLSLMAWPRLLGVAAWVLLPFPVLSFGLSHSPLAALTRRGDYSYGIYIYAFPFQQTVTFLAPHLGLMPYLLICGAVILSMAMLSFHLVERRALALKPRRQQPAAPECALVETTAAYGLEPPLPTPLPGEP